MRRLKWVVGLLLLASSAHAAPSLGMGASSPTLPVVVGPVIPFESGGAGPVTFAAPEPQCATAGLVCTAGDSCQCFEATGKITEGITKGANYDFLLSVDLSHLYNSGMTATGVCFMSGGVLSISGVLSKLVMETSGPACNGLAVGNVMYSGAFIIDSGTGAFQKVKGGSGFFTLGGKGGVGMVDVRGVYAN